jgi:Xaa-Pro aminopeptidase
MNYSHRIAKVRERMTHADVDAVLLSVGADLPYLTGYEAMPLERLTMLVLPRHGDVRLVVARLEAPRVEPRPEFEVVAWDEPGDPIAMVAGMLGRAPRVAVGDQTWAGFVLDLQRVLPATEFRRASAIVGPVRAVKDAEEIAALRAAGAAVDQVAAEMRARPFAGRTEIDVHRELVDRMLELGHQRANFAIVGAADHAASPHHEPGARVINDGDVVLCDFGGTMNGYCSDITRMFHVGGPTPEVTETYEVLREAQEAAVGAARVGTPCAAVDAAARSIISAAGFGDRFIHRTGHGIGAEAHEDPYIVSGNAEPLVAGNAFSVEPGIYLPGRFGLRLEDIVVATEAGPDRLNHADRGIAVVG